MLLEKGRGQVLARISCSGGTRGPAWQKPSKTQIGGKIGTKSSRRLSRGSSEDYRISWLEFVEELSGARFLYTFNDLGVSRARSVDCHCCYRRLRRTPWSLPSYRLAAYGKPESGSGGRVRA